jgi:hypothetical protein
MQQSFYFLLHQIDHFLQKSHVGIVCNLGEQAKSFASTTENGCIFKRLLPK